MRPPRALPAVHFERNDVTTICETVHYSSIIAIFCRGVRGTGSDLGPPEAGSLLIEVGGGVRDSSSLDNIVI